MSVEVKFFANFREIVGKKKISASADSVDELLVSIAREHEDMEDELFVDIEGRELNDYVNILVNGRRIGALDGLATKLDDGDTVAIFPPVSGG